jgi:hypothetical protein
VPITRVLASLALISAIAVGSAGPAAAMTPAAPSGTTTVTTSSGLSLTATPVKGLNPKGATVRVKGKGFDMTKGIYVALCVKPKKGHTPTPCAGGVNTTGKKSASYWISSNPPSYGKNLAIPYGPGGTFSVKLTFPSHIGSIDCHKVTCAIVTRADHLNSADRRFDVAIPVKFAR